MGCLASVKDILRLPRGAKHWGRAFIHSHHLQYPILWDQSPTVPAEHLQTASWPQDFSASSPAELRLGHQLPQDAAPHFHPIPVAFGSILGSVSGSQIKIKATLASIPACGEPLETRATAQRFCLPSQGCSRQNNAPAN